MIRYVDLTGQLTLEDDEFYFAWYDTISDQFLSFTGQQTFSSWGDFMEAFKEHVRDDDPTHGHRDLSRFYGLYSRNKGRMDIERSTINIYEFAEKMYRARLLPQQIEYFEVLGNKKGVRICLGRNMGGTSVGKILIELEASKAIGRFARWAAERRRNEEGKTG